MDLCQRQAKKSNDYGPFNLALGFYIILGFNLAFSVAV